MRKFFYLMALCIPLIISAQEDDGNILLPKNRKNTNPFENWTLGGNVGFSVGGSLWGISVAPRVGYKLTESLELAFKVNYNYQGGKNVQYQFLGLGPSVNYYFLRSAYGQVSYQHYFISQKFSGNSRSYPLEESALYLGAGYLQPLGGNTYAQLGFTYNVLYKKDKSIFSSGFAPSVGIIIGL